MPHIHIRFEQPELQATTLQADEGYSILEAVLLNNIHLNHNCGGVCACTTCHIYVEKGSELLEEISDREEDYIDRATNPRLESRLACQCIILADEGDINIIIPDQSGIIGHEH
jgi:2Fe-2S ferredoxin